MPKKEFISRLMHERDRFELLLNRAGYARRMTLKGVAGRWSIKDMLALVLAHEQFLADRMAEIANHETYTPCRTQTALDAFLDEFGYPDFGSPLLNDESPREWVIERYKKVSLDDIIVQELQAFASIISSLEKLPGPVIARHDLYDRVARHTWLCYREHSHDIKRWLKANGTQVK